MKRNLEFSLQAHNTLAVPSVAEQWVEVASQQALQDVLEQVDRQQCALTVLGGGSNVVLPDRVEGLVVKPRIMGKDIVQRSADAAIVKIGAGEDWPSFVSWSLEQRLYGLENLALIPGTVGAAPVQNIGAYGVELAELVDNVEVIYRRDGRREVLSAAACEFGYRDSVFKTRLRDQCVIVSVSLRLFLEPRINLTYPVLQQKLSGRRVVSPRDVFAAICTIRRERLPDPQVLPNAGSFFKNPYIAHEQCQDLLSRYPGLVVFPAPVAGHSKLAAAWLIEQAGWKGVSRYDIQVHDRQALVLTNPRRRPGSNVIALAEAIREDILERFGVLLEQEPQRLGWS